MPDNCALCGTPFMAGDEPVPVVVAITGQGVATGDAHPWCAKAVANPVPAAS